MVKLKMNKPVIWTPDNCSIETAFKQTTHLGIGAHADDLEIIAFEGIVRHFQSKKSNFFGILLSDNRGKPIHPLYKNFALAKIQKIRENEQKKAALLGEYLGLCFLRYPSAFIRSTRHRNEVEGAVKRLIEKIKPSVIYTHSLTDKHPTHRAAACRVIEALKRTAPDKRPKCLYGIGVWGGLDWLPDEKRKAFDVSGYEELASKLLKAYKSQVFGLHRYDAAVLSRRRANAIFHRSRGFTKSSSIIYAMELTSLINNPKLTIKKYLKKVVSGLYENSSAI